MALTKKDIENLTKVFITKEDAKAFATKKDLEAFATKKDLEAFATKKDLEAFATKKDLETLAKRIDDLPRYFATKQDLEKFPTREEMNAKFDQVNKTLDWLVKAFRDLKEELTIRFGQFKRHDEQLENHEKRIKTLEEKVFVS